ncbi:MAG: SUMF1/EgtB/PvdO family nonheme iron enzyme [bacterium]
MNVQSVSRGRRIVIAAVTLLLVAAVALAARKCPKCGATYPDEDNFCAECTGEDGRPVRLVPVETSRPRPKRVEGKVTVSGDTLAVSSSPAGAAVKLDGTYVGNTPTTVTGVAVGEHEVRIQAQGYSDCVVTARVLAPAGPVARGRNAQGYEEALWLKDSSVMVKIPAGTFTMGSTEFDDEKPVRQVYLDAYYIDKHEVTNRQYRRFCDATGRSYPQDPDFLGKPDYLRSCPDYPVVNVSWDDAKAYCDWAGKRLPTEAEWEKAARGTDAREYPWGSSAPGSSRNGNFADESAKRRYSDWTIITGYDDGYVNTAPVGAFPAGASPYGLLDMAGNVWEWCDDWYDKDYYGRGANNNPQGPATG